MREKAREEAFLKRYGKVIECDVEYNIDTKVLKDYTVTFKSPKNTFSIKEYLKDGLTDYVVLTHKNKQWKHTRFLDAEISVADILGDEIGEKIGKC